MSNVPAALVEAIAASVAPFGAHSVEAQVFGTVDPDVAARALADICTVDLGVTAVDVQFYWPSTGCVAGLTLADGRRVVVKSYQPRWGDTFLAAVLQVQSWLAAHDFPCARPLGGPYRLRRPNGEELPGRATVEELREDPGTRPFGSDDLDASASGLARLVSLLASPAAVPLEVMGGLRPHPLDAPSDGSFPEPHSPVFDFAGTGAGAQWIDDLARTAARHRATGAEAPEVVAHTDWAARNVRIAGGALVAVYDWDSLAVVSETTAVGQAAATWSAVGGDDEPMAPSPGDVARFVRSYEIARGHDFDDAAVRRTGAAALWVLAYSARCEHAVRARQWGTPERASARLRTDADGYLELADLVAELR